MVTGGTFKHGLVNEGLDASEGRNKLPYYWLASKTLTHDCVFYMIFFGSASIMLSIFYLLQLKRMLPKESLMTDQGLTAVANMQCAGTRTYQSCIDALSDKLNSYFYVVSLNEWSRSLKRDSKCMHE